MENILEFQHISKYFPGVKALDDISVAFQKGEIHAIVGENGAGKSTLIKTCTGALYPSEGEIIFEGKKYNGLTPHESLQLGIIAIYQELNLVNDLSVAENIYLGCAFRNGIFIDREKMIAESRKLFQVLNININPKTTIKNLTVGFQQMVEIAKAISKKTKVLIMDEPTAPLSTREVQSMFDVVRRLKAQGVTIIYISHRLEEIFEIADRVTVMRDGHLIRTMHVRETSKDDLITLMVGRKLEETYPGRENIPRGETVLEVRNLTGNGVKDISFSVKQGEILGLGGLIGAGRTETAELLFGAKKTERGEILYHGEPKRFRNPSDALDAGIALVPEDRKKQGIFKGLSIENNISLSVLKRLSSGPLIKHRLIRETVKKYDQRIRIKAVNMDVLAGTLSGGNQQKVIIAKVLCAEPDVLIFDEPTRGIDVGARREIYQIMNDLVKDGKAIIMISSDMEELLGMSDRIIVLCEGRITGEVSKEEFDQETILKYSSESTAGREQNAG